MNTKLTARFRRILGRKQRHSRPRASFLPQSLQLEERQLLSIGVQVPTTNVKVPLSKIFWNGEARPLNTDGRGLPNIQSPADAGSMKTLTIKNNGDATIYPFLRGQNIGFDDNAKPPGPYDPQDKKNHEFREYIGFSMGGKDFLGLPKGATVTIQVPLVLWENNMYVATSGKEMTSPLLAGYDKKAQITIAATNKVSGTEWVRSSSGYASAMKPEVMFYYSDIPKTVPNDFPAQLTEMTFRDQYLKQFISDPNETHALLNYDVSYVNNLIAPIAMEASKVPITYQTNPEPAPPTYFGFENFGWAATNKNAAPFESAVADFVANKKDSEAFIGQYFGGKGWPKYYSPPNDPFNIIPAGSNLFANSPLTTGKVNIHKSSYDANRWLLTSNGDAPIQAGGAGLGFQGFVRQGQQNRIYLPGATPKFAKDLREMLKAGAVNVSYPDNPALTTVVKFVPKSGSTMAYVTLKSNAPLSGDTGKVYAFTRTASDYAVTAITNLWYSWAQYHVQHYQNFIPDTINATLGFTKNNHATNVITLNGTPKNGLDLGMVVTAPGVPTGTTILKIDGNKIHLSQIPDDTTAPTQDYTFSKPVPIKLDPNYTTPYDLKFDDAATPKAQKFAASVYEAMSAEAAVNPLPDSALPYSMNLISQVIQFYAKLPGYTRPDLTGPILVGEVRDVVKSILRGVYDFNQVPDQSQWYPPPKDIPSGLLSGQQFNVYNLDPYVWFVHRVENMSGYGFSVDDDVSNPQAVGPLLAEDKSPNHAPSNLQVEFGGTTSFGNTNQWFPTIPWGTKKTMATISVQQTGEFKGQSVVKFVGPDALKIYNQINNPGDEGQVGATITGQGIPANTTLIHKGPNSGLIPEIVLSQKATNTNTPIPVTIFAIP